MNYIEASEFLNQPEKVREALLKSIKLQNGTPYVASIYDYNTKEYHYNDEVEFYNQGMRSFDGCLPLPTEGQLRKFIIDKGYKYIGINNFLEADNGKVWNIKIFKNMMQFEPDVEFYSDTPLNCYWKAATFIAKFLVKGE